MSVLKRVNSLKPDKMSNNMPDMGFFNKFFGDSDNKVNASSAISWNNLTELKQLDSIVEESREIPVILFKHSTRCAISRMALKQFEQEYGINDDAAKPYFLDLLQHRDISNAIAERFDVMHQSPQVILVKGGKAVYDTSHGDINAGVMKTKI